MTRPGIEPIGHVSPRKPVDLNPRAAVTKTPHRAGEISEQHARVWDAAVSTATGSNISGARPDVSEETHTLTVEQVHAIAGQVDGYFWDREPAAEILKYLAIRSAEFLRRAAASEQKDDASEPEGHVWGRVPAAELFEYLNTDSDNDGYMG